jgi:hypothetical protein
MTFSLNNRLVLEAYVKDGLRAKVQNGIATPGQRDGLKGLRVLVGTVLADGRHIPKGSTAYIREETLHNAAWAAKLLTCDFLTEKFILANLQDIELISTPDEAA